MSAWYTTYAPPLARQRDSLPLLLRSVVFRVAALQSASPGTDDELSEKYIHGAEVLVRAV